MATDGLDIDPAFWEERKRRVEEQRTRVYGPPEVRDGKRKEYVAELVRMHSEALIRDVLAALAELPDFIPARRLKEAGPRTAPLEDMIRAYDLPWFYLKVVVSNDGHTVEVNANHGFNLAARGEEFIFSKTEEGLKFVSCRLIVIS